MYNCWNLRNMVFWVGLVGEFRSDLTIMGYEKTEE